MLQDPVTEETIVKPENGMEMHALPIQAIFKAANEQGCAIIDARTDSYCEYPGMVSHTFVALKQA